MPGVSDPATFFSIRRAVPEDRDRLVDIWWWSARATHLFLSLRELEALLPEVRALRLETLDTWVLCPPGSEAVGFLVMEGRSVEGLFILPEWRRRGGGTRLMHHAGRMAERLTVEVNEQNADALAFYLAQGFEIVRRSATDRSGRPYPLLHLEESAMSAIARQFHASMR
jgi:putative acetyltransferase